MPLGPLDISNINVLVVDSNAHTRAITTTILRGAGVTRVKIAETDPAAVEFLRSTEPHLAVFEWEDKGINGLFLARRVRAGMIGPNRALPIILLTSKASLSDVNDARMVGVNEYCIKPISAHVLMTRINEVVHRPRDFVDSPEYVGPCRRRKFLDAYGGPLRRLSDPTEEFLDDPMEEENKKRLKMRIDRLARAASELIPGDRTRLRNVLVATTEMQAMAQDVGDGFLTRAAASLLRYLNGVGASSKLDPTIIDTHVDAMRQLLALPNIERELRDRVAAGLDKVVDKRLQSARGC
jgi:DNA-binding response OmpR family regulator